MKMKIIKYFICSACQKNLSLLINKKVKDRIIEGELECKNCDKRYTIKNQIACFASCAEKQFERNTQKLRKITKEQEIPKKWVYFFPKKELTALKREWDFLLSGVKKDKSAIHLDFATGTGRFLRNIVLKTKGEIVALDNGYGTCEELQYFLKEIKKYNRVSVVCADARKMPFKEETFDSISSWHGLDEAGMEEAVKESRRVLKDGAYLTASGIHYPKDSKSFSIARKYDIKFITKKAIIQALRKASFKKVEHKIFFQGKCNQRESYLPVFGDLYSIFAIKAEK